MMLRNCSKFLSFQQSFIFSRNLATKVSGTVGSSDFKVEFFDSNQKLISPWHDIPLSPNNSQTNEEKTFNFITEIPKFSRAKLEIATKQQSNPIKQDSKNGQPRFYHGPIFWNYGCIPQTWENPHKCTEELNAYGDNDPLDVVEIGSQSLEMGSVTEIKVIGSLALIDDGEVDWKVIGINLNDPLAKTVENITDLHNQHPEIISGVREWFRWYKYPDGKLNTFGYKEEAKDRLFTEQIIQETHEEWKNLLSGSSNRGKLWVPVH